MGMVVRSNIMALNANRQLGMNNSQVSKSLEKLSSGYKINRAGDDASGLAISEKMKAQIKGLETASANSQDGISLVQTAEGALTEVHDMLNRMVELAGKAANGTIDSETDRAALQDEMNSLLDEIDRIAESTDFNGIKLLNGDLAANTVKLSGISLSGQTTSTTVDATKAVSTQAIGAGTAAAAQVTVEYTDANGKLQSVTVDYTGSATDTDNAAAIRAALAADSNLSSLFEVGGTGTSVTFTAKEAGEGGVKITSMTSTDAAGTAIGKLTFADGADAYETVTDGATGITAGDKVTVNGTVYEFVDNAGDEPTTEGAVAVLIGADADASVANLNKALESEGITVEKNADDLLFKPMSDGKGLTLQIGPTGDEYNKVTINVGNMSSKGLGIDNLRNVGIMSQDAASAALDQIKNGADSAINTVSSVRAELGAMQNRLEHTINNLDVAAENMESANSQIRDTDMAKEMMEYTKQNVLTQAAQAMLAQANQQPQSILQLLQ